MDKIHCVVSNSDLTEGRGRPIRIAYCQSKVTAERLAVGKGVMGSNAYVESYDLMFIGDKPVIPLTMIDIQYPTDADIKIQNRRDSMAEIVKKAKIAGLTDDEISLLSGSVK